ncbi:cytochrome C oxidase subunit IV family protein [Salicibibacter cibarius]|uniref:Cytochrome C oxidase subunit IV family protein n=1 Tax=Salicibibacter cibarius TaxID=2743000 RepID=A0A7T6Z4H6_9BACI|nr:cytochrome C oxidase subunit IV family protein [Salicibibacter cibarius]QQK76764.1 cytochrome C oxidase subunit IV family protein [Salicibibacter cibarius]
MAENLDQPFKESAMNSEERRKINREQRTQVIAFAFMIGITILAFLAVGAEGIPNAFTVPFILLLALVQLILQLYYFMHLKDKDHGWPNSFMISGLVLAAPMIAALILLLGVVKY